MIEAYWYPWTAYNCVKFGCNVRYHTMAVPVTGFNFSVLKLFVNTGVMHKKFKAHASALGMKDGRVIAMNLPVDEIIQLTSAAIDRFERDPQIRQNRETLQLIDGWMERLSTNFLDEDSPAICRFRHLATVPRRSRESNKGEVISC